MMFVGLDDLVCIECDQFIHPIKNEEYDLIKIV